MEKFVKVQNKYNKKKSIARYYIDDNGKFVSCMGVYIAVMANKASHYKDCTPLGDTKNTSVGGGVYDTLEDMEEEWNIVA